MRLKITLIRIDDPTVETRISSPAILACCPEGGELHEQPMGSVVVASYPDTDACDGFV